MRKRHVISAAITLAASLCVLFSSFARAADRKEITDFISSVRAEYAPDLRLNFVEIRFGPDDDEVEVVTTSFPMFATLANAKNAFPDWRFTAKLYPENNTHQVKGRPISETWRALVNFSSIQLQKKFDHASEWGTQAVMGTPVRVIEQVNGWLLIQTPDGYLGYTPAGSVTTLTREEFKRWLDSPRVITLDNYGFIYSEPSLDSATVSDLTAGCVLVWKEKEVRDGFYRVETPDGRLGWIPQKSASEWNEWLDSRELTADNIISTARRFLGSPYVWGGTTSKGVDCSGLVSLTFRLNGYTILRDVSQIQREGIDVDISQGYGAFQPGDLLIFGIPERPGTPARYRHVGIYIGDGLFIHSATSVHESSLNPDSPLYDEYNAQQLIKVVRMIGAEYTEHFRPIKDNQFLKEEWR